MTFVVFTDIFFTDTLKKKNQVFGESTLSVKFWFNLSRKSAEVIFNVFSISHKKKSEKNSCRYSNNQNIMLTGEGDTVIYAN